MREPFCWFSLPACVIALFAQCASARQQSDDLAASPIRNEALAQAVTRESPNGAPAAPETGSRPTTSRKEAPSTGQIPKGATAARESQNRAPAVHESRKKKEPPAARERRALRDKLNSGLVGIVFGGMDDADFSEAVDLGAVIGSPDIKIMRRWRAMAQRRL
jgi:hypothetical protein